MLAVEQSLSVEVIFHISRVEELWQLWNLARIEEEKNKNLVKTRQCGLSLLIPHSSTCESSFIKTAELSLNFWYAVFLQL